MWVSQRAVSVYQYQRVCVSAPRISVCVMYIILNESPIKTLVSPTPETPAYPSLLLLVVIINPVGRRDVERYNHRLKPNNPEQLGTSGDKRPSVSWIWLMVI